MKILHLIPSDREGCLAVGMVDHVSKPIDLNQLIATLLSHTGRSQGRIASEPIAAEASTTQSPLAIDVEAAISRIGGDRDFYVQIAQLFQTDAITQVADMERHLKLDQWSDAARSAHTLKGLAGTVGATALAADCAAIEVMLKKKRQSSPGFSQEFAASTHRHPGTTGGLACNIQPRRRHARVCKLTRRTGHQNTHQRITGTGEAIAGKQYALHCRLHANWGAVWNDARHTICAVERRDPTTELRGCACTLQCLASFTGLNKRCLSEHFRAALLHARATPPPGAAF